MKAFMKSTVVLLAVIVLSFSLFKYWPYIFSRTVVGVISDVQRVATPVAVMSGGPGASAKDLFSFAVAISEKSGEIVTASSEDRQWAVVKAGQCAEAKFYPYPPWEFDKSGTYFGARLLKLFDCENGKFSAPQAVPSPAEAVPETGAAGTTPDAAGAAAAAAEAASAALPQQSQPARTGK